MQLFAQWAPTQFDTRGLGPDDRQAWLVVGVIQTRDSEARERSNFRCTVRALEKLDPNGADHEIHRFGHWGPGWFEIILVRSETPAAKEAQEITDGLADYPIVDDMDCSELEHEEFMASLHCYTWAADADFATVGRLYDVADDMKGLMESLGIPMMYDYHGAHTGIEGYCIPFCGDFAKRRRILRTLESLDFRIVDDAADDG